MENEIKTYTVENSLYASELAQLLKLLNFLNEWKGDIHISDAIEIGDSNGDVVGWVGQSDDGSWIFSQTCEDAE